jgi:hypothetical protein
MPKSYRPKDSHYKRFERKSAVLLYHITAIPNPPPIFLATDLHGLLRIFIARPAAATKKFLTTKLHEGTRRKKMVVILRYLKLSLEEVFQDSI